MADGIFRQSALKRLSSPEELDQTITVAGPFGWIALCAAGVLLCAVLAWGVTGSIPEKANGQGVLINSGELKSVAAASGGIVKDVFLENGAEIRKGQTIARLERQDLLEQLQVSSQRLLNLLQSYDSEAGPGASGMADKTLSESEKNLKDQIAALTEQIGDAKRKEQSMKALYNSGQITEASYLSARNELFSLQRQKLETEQRLSSAGMGRMTAAGDLNQRLLSLRRQIDEAGKQLEIQQESYQNATRIVSTVSGIVREIPIASGSYISPGTTVAVIEPHSENGGSLGATIYFPVQEGKKIKRGMNIAVSPSTARQEEFGYIQGIVISVSDFPVSEQYLQATLQNPNLARAFSQLETPIEVKVSLIPDPAAKSGYRWSSSKGPAGRLDAGILCSGSVTVRTQRPISLVIPLAQKKLFGIGE